MNYYNGIKEKLIDNEVYSKIKDYSKVRHRVITYFEIGRLLNEVGSIYGENIIEKYSKKLMLEVGKKYKERNLRYMRKFYEMFENEIWNNYCYLICIDGDDENGVPLIIINEIKYKH